MGKIVDGIYYGSDGNPVHRGAVEVEGKLYYAGKDGVLVRDADKTIHHGMGNGLVKHGTYHFDKNGVLEADTFRAAQETTEDKKEKEKKTSLNTKISDLKTKVQKEKKKLTKQEKWGLYGGIGLILLVCIFFIGRAIVTKGTYSVQDASNDGGTEFSMELPSFEEDVYLCTTSMQGFYEGTSSLESAIKGSGSSGYEPFVFKYKISNAKKATLYLKEQDSAAETVEYPLNVDAFSLTIDNLKTGISYAYRVTAVDHHNKSHDASGDFTIAETNRFVYFPGVYNTRDIGGYNTKYGKKVKQGLLIRGTEMDGLVEPTYYLTDVEAVKPFGFVCDFDLRNPDIFNTNYISPLGQNVTHKFYNSPMYGGIFAKGSEDYLRQIFTDLANAKNYPMYLHCTYGADRTGTIVFLLQGILGVSEEDMNREYQLTGIFSSGYASGDSLNSIYSGLKGVSGNTINEKIENYLVGTIGITADQITGIRNNFLE